MTRCGDLRNQERLQQVAVGGRVRIATLRSQYSRMPRTASRELESVLAFALSLTYALFSATVNGAKPCMRLDTQKRSSTAAAVLFDLLNPIPFGFFVGALIFDVTYTNNADVLWLKSASWLIVIGLLVAVIPRLINLFRVWCPGTHRSAPRERAAFFVYLLGIAAAIVNAFVHSRDAYGVMPEGMWLSVLTVGLLIVGNVLVTLQHSNNYPGVQV